MILVRSEFFKIINITVIIVNKRLLLKQILSNNQAQRVYYKHVDFKIETLMNICVFAVPG